MFYSFHQNSISPVFMSLYGLTMQYYKMYSKYISITFTKKPSKCLVLKSHNAKSFIN